MLRGTAGTGKSEMSKAIAAGLGLPYTALTCSANTEIQDLRGQYVPVTEGSKNISLPSYQDFQYDPTGLYHRLTGEEVEYIETEVLFDRILKACSHKIESGQQFEYIESPLVKAIRYGWVCEIQEISAIADRAVLNGINSILDNCQFIQLENGEIVTRHPNTVIIMTTNIGYEGSRGINQSIISRQQLIMDFDELTLEQMMERTINVTDFCDNLLLAKMAKAILAIAKLCKDKMITGGSVGMRELITWAQSTMISGDPKQSAEYTVLASATADPEDREQIKECLENFF